MSDLEIRRWEITKMMFKRFPGFFGEGTHGRRPDVVVERFLKTGGIFGRFEMCKGKW